MSELSAGTVTYHAMSENAGPAGAAAYALDWLTHRNYDWIYWGDDDDPPPSPDTFERLLTVAAAAGEDTGAVGAVGAMWDWDKGVIRRLPDDALSGLVNVDTIAGGQHLMIRREVVANVGLPDSRLFFGLEELDYCLRIRRAGYRLMVSGDLMKECRARSGRLGCLPPRPVVPHHAYEALWRRSYSTRNYIFAMNRTFGRPDLARRELFKALARMCFSLGRGPRYGLGFMKLQWRGVVDGYLGRMGRTVSPKPKHSRDVSPSGRVVPGGARA